MTRNVGRYLNDQKSLKNYAEHIYPTIEQLHKWGVELTTDEKGNLAFFPMPVGLWSQIGINLYATENMRKTAVKEGVRIQNNINITALINTGGRVVGAVGFDIVDGTFYIFRAKTVILACGACNFRATRMFTNSGEGNALAFNAGAQMRSAEFLFMEVAAAETGETIHGAQPFVYNQTGENIWKKYVHWDAQDVCVELILGMVEEYEAGRGPLYMDLTKMDEAFKVIGADPANPFIGNLRRLFPDKISWVKRIVEREHDAFGGLGDKIPAKFALHGNSGFVRVDTNMKTTVDGLYTVGLDTGNGSAIFGSAPQPADQRGGPFMYCTNTGCIGGTSAAEDAKTVGSLAEIPADLVAGLKAEAFVGLNKTDGIDPRKIFGRMQNAVIPVDVIIKRSEKSLNKAIGLLDEIKADLPKMGAKDYHDLKLCREAETMALSSEIVLKSALERKESRNFHFREDYPKPDNKNWLKWVLADKVNGKVVISTEEVPFKDYPIQPAGI
jgi:succinate dehydrogenase/fumarate reductase flavoprotein subunit